MWQHQLHCTITTLDPLRTFFETKFIRSKASLITAMDGIAKSKEVFMNLEKFTNPCEGHAVMRVVHQH